MDELPFRRIAVIGAGLMGGGIALDFALSGRIVRVTDADPECLSALPSRLGGDLALLAEHGRATESAEIVLARVTTHRTLAEAVADADLVIKTVSENLALKQGIFRELEPHAPPHAILASNTSSLMPSTLGAATGCPERVLVAHYFNPAHLMPLVELVAGEHTDAAHVQALHELYLSMGKAPVIVNQEALGFIGNRLQFALIREALALVEAGIATPADVDTVLRSSLALRMPVTGVFASMDLAGLDTMLAICRLMFPDLSAAAAPGPSLAERVAAGKRGTKANAGWYEYAPGEAEALRRRLAIALLHRTG